MSLIGIPGQLMKIDSDLLAEISKMKKSDLLKHINITLALEEKRFEQIPIEITNLDTRIVKTLKDNGINTVKDLMVKTTDELLALKGIGLTAITKITEFFNKL